MPKDYRKTKHRKFLVQYHIILVIKYRKQLMLKCGRLVKEYPEIYASKTNVEVEIAEVINKDHLHIYFALTRLFSMSKDGLLDSGNIQLISYIIKAIQ